MSDGPRTNRWVYRPKTFSWQGSVMRQELDMVNWPMLRMMDVDVVTLSLDRCETKRGDMLQVQQFQSYPMRTAS